MKLVQSLWSRTLGVEAAAGAVAGDWPTWSHYWYSWVLSGWQAHLTHGVVDLVTDDFGARVLVEELGLPYRKIDLSLNECSVHPALSAYGNLWAFSRQDEPFLHLEHDVYIWKRLPSHALGAPVVVEGVDCPVTYDGFHHTYTQRIAVLHELLPWLPPSWLDFSKNPTAINTGVFGGRDFKLIQACCKQAMQVIDHPDNAEAWRALVSKGPRELQRYNVPAERFSLACELSAREASLVPLFSRSLRHVIEEESDAFGITHVGDTRSSKDTGFFFRLEQQVRENYPNAWRRIEEGIDLTEVMASDDIQVPGKLADHVRRDNAAESLGAGPRFGRPLTEAIHDTQSKAAPYTPSEEGSPSESDSPPPSIDVIYPYINPKHHSESLRYSIRSVEKYLGCNARIWVVGDKPSWLNTDSVRFIQQKRIGKRPYRRYIDWVAKLMTAVRDERMGSRFVLMYDDLFFVDPTSIDHLAYPFASEAWTPERLSEWKPRHAWRRLRKLTLEHVLESRGVAYEFETHVPKLFEREKILALADRYNFGKDPWGIHTLYFNEDLDFDPLTTSHRSRTLRSSPSIAASDLIRQLPGHRIINHTGELDRHGGYETVLSMLFPSPTSHELLQEPPVSKYMESLPGANISRSKINRPDITVITPTGDRQALFELTERWMRRQTFTGNIQWIIADDGVEPTIPTMGQEYIRNEGTTFPQQLLSLLKHVRSEKLLIWDDDDWYAPNYIETMDKWLDYAPLVASCVSRRYAPSLGKNRVVVNRRMGITAQTGMGSEVYDIFASVCKTGTMRPDRILWEKWIDGGGSCYMHPNDEPLFVGIKGMPGRANVTAGLVAKSLEKNKWQDDVGRRTATQWFGEDFKLYQAILDNEPENTRGDSVADRLEQKPCATASASKAGGNILSDSGKEWLLPTQSQVEKDCDFDLTLITPTCDRPEMFGLLELWISRQSTDRRLQWIVCDYGEMPAQPSMGQLHLVSEPSETHKESDMIEPLMSAISRVRSDKLLFINDTNYYGPTYLDHMSDLLDRYPLVGEGLSRHYKLETEQCYRSPNRHFAILGQTGMRSDRLDWLADAVRIVPGDRWVDMRLWKIAGEDAHLFLDGDDELNLFCSMLGMPGRERLDLKKRRQEEFSLDPDGSILERWVGEDAVIFQDLAERLRLKGVNAG